MTISNPVLTGFYADPSMIRVGDTYYIANSTFEWWPGVTLHQSKDLANWQPVASPLNSITKLDMKGNPSSGGIWAPDLSYADGLFWLIYTDVKVVNGAFKDCTNYLITAPSIEGPWSDPYRLDGVGFDASLFHDDDGRKYLVQQTWDYREWHHPFNGITLTELNTETMKLMPETARRIWAGTAVKVTEGPHIYKKDGYYYLFAAEGGTMWEHQESVARSRTLDADSFEVMPNNPFIGNYVTPESYLQKQGHGALVDTPSGEWYYASLTGRPLHDATEPVHGTRGWCPLGRETSIQKVEWDEDGWPYVVGGPAGQRYVPEPVDAIATEPEQHNIEDDFTSTELEIGWNTLRVPFDETMGTVGDGALTLYGQGSLCNLFELSLVARRWRAFQFTATTCVEFNPSTYMQMAGLTNYYADMFWSWAYISWDEERQTRVIDVAQNDRNVYTTFLRENAVAIPEDVTKVWLRSKTDGITYRYEYSFDGEDWQPLGPALDSCKLSDEYVQQTYGGFFTGAFVGMAAVDLAGYRTPARFTEFSCIEDAAE